MWQVRTALDTEDGDEMADAAGVPSSAEPAAVTTTTAGGATGLLEEPTTPTVAAALEAVAKTQATETTITTPTPLPNTEGVAEVAAQPAAAAVAPKFKQTADV